VLAQQAKAFIHNYFFKKSIVPNSSQPVAGHHISLAFSNVLFSGSGVSLKSVFLILSKPEEFI